MHSSLDQLPLAEAEEGYEGRFTEWGELTVAYETIPAARGRMLTTFPENMPVQFVQDAEWWGKHSADVNDRWNKWVLQ